MYETITFVLHSLHKHNASVIPIQVHVHADQDKVYV